MRNLLLLLLLHAGCIGESSITPSAVDPDSALSSNRYDGGIAAEDATLTTPIVPRDGGDDRPGQDADQQTDAGDDMSAAPTCPEIPCGSGASCVESVCTCDEGLLGDPYTGCSAENPCDGVDCPAGASCSANGMCECDPFFSGDGNTCTPTEPAADLSSRTDTEVCDIWRSSYDRSSGEFWLVEPVADCTPGVLHPEEMRTALHRTSIYRMLVGLYPVSLDANQLENVQDCAMMHAAQDAGLDHEPPESWACYTASGAAGAGSSNLAGGVGSPAGTVGLYVGDVGVASLGHRRWIFNPSMGGTAFGHRASYGCMYAFGGGRNHNPEFVAYPAPGPFPKNAVSGKWSISGGGSWTDQHTVTVTNMSDGTGVPVSNITAPVFGFLPSTLSWGVSTNQLATDVDYRVSISDENGQMVREYTTRLIGCP